MVVVPVIWAVEEALRVPDKERAAKEEAPPTVRLPEVEMLLPIPEELHHRPPP